MFTEEQKLKIITLKSSIASYYNLQMKKIGDRKLEALFYEHCVISGGCISSLFHDEPVNDIDLYAKTNAGLLIVKEYIINCSKNIKNSETYKLDDDGVTHIKVSTNTPLITPNAVTLTNDVQFIYIDTWEKCKTSFDYLHCTPHYDLSTQKLFMSEAQYDCIVGKHLVERIPQVLIKHHRYTKYYSRGWRSKDSLGIIAQEIGNVFPQTVQA
jgi:hypothetical protein